MWCRLRGEFPVTDDAGNFVTARRRADVPDHLRKFGMKWHFPPPHLRPENGGNS